MKSLYTEGETIFVKLPGYTYRRRAVIIDYDDKSHYYMVQMDKSKKTNQVTEDQISEIIEKKALRAPPNQDSYSDIPELVPESISGHLTPSSVRKRTEILSNHVSSVYDVNSKKKKSDINGLSNEVELIEDVTKESSFIATPGSISNDSITNEVQLINPIWLCYSFSSFLLFFYVIFGGFCMHLLNSCFEGQCSVILPDHFKKIISTFESMLNQYNILGIVVIFIFSHLALYAASRKFTSQNKSLNIILPVAMSLLICFVYRFSIVNFQLLFDNMHDIVVLYLIIAVVVFMSTLLLEGKIDEQNLKVFLEQHSVVQLTFMFIFHIFQMPTNKMENFSFYYLFLFCYIIICIARINDVGRVNCFDLIFARPFLLTIPIHNSISFVPLRWPTVYYVPIFIAFMFSFLKQFDSKTELSSFCFNFYNSLVKLCMASLAGFHFYSIPSWVSVFSELFVEHIF